MEPKLEKLKKMENNNIKIMTKMMMKIMLEATTMKMFEFIILNTF
jgi:hypothetical protein